MTRFIILLLVNVYISVSVAAERCVEIAKSENPYGDKTIVCGPGADEIIGNLNVVKKREQFSGKSYSAELEVKNNNPVEITVRSLLAKFVDASGEIVGLCTNDISGVLGPGNQNSFTIKCPNYKFQAAKEKEVSDVLFTATPHSGT